MMKPEISKWLNEQFQGSAETIDLVWQEYLTSIESKIELSRKALAESDYSGLDRLAHSVKGDALMVGDTQMAQSAIALRDASKSSDAARAAQALDEIAALDRENRSDSPVEG